jgi:hypothetical protein
MVPLLASKMKVLKRKIEGSLIGGTELCTLEYTNEIVRDTNRIDRLKMISINKTL